MTKLNKQDVDITISKEEIIIKIKNKNNEENDEHIPTQRSTNSEEYD